jgi:hypothetical protein
MKWLLRQCWFALTFLIYLWFYSCFCIKILDNSLIGLVSVFSQPASEFIPMSRCSRKTMVAFKDTRNYTGSSRSATSSLRDGSSACFSVNCSKVLTMGYARRVKEVGEWRGTDRIKSRESAPLKVPWLPLSRVRGQVTYREKGSLDWVVVSLREGKLAILACK